MNNYIELSKDELLNILKNYMSKIYGKEVSVIERHSIVYGSEKTIKLELLYVYSSYTKTSTIRLEYEIKEDDVKEALKEFLFNKGLEFDSYSYLGYIRNVGYFCDEDEAIFEGIRVYYKEKELKKVLK